MIELAEDPKPKAKRGRKPKAVAPPKPKPDGSVVLLFKTEITPEEKTNIENRIRHIAKELDALRKEATQLKAKRNRRATAEKCRVKVDMESMRLTDADTGHDVHPSRLSGPQWGLVIEAAKAALQA